MRDSAVRVDIGVGGRFHADHLTRALLDAGYDAHLWSSLPAGSLGDLPRDRTHSFPTSEVLYRGLKSLGAERLGEWGKMVLFGRRLNRALRGRQSDTFIGWSCFALETLRAARHQHKVLIRDSSHITTQIQILDNEYARLGKRFGSRRHTIARETEEYQLADRIIVLSEFARRSFLEHGVPEEKLRILRLGVDTARFSPGKFREAESRARDPLKVVYFGAISVRKGVHYLLDAVSSFVPRNVQLTLIGAADPILAARLRGYPQVRHFGPRPQASLALFLQDADVFVMPTVEDGFGQTVIQAMASGLVPIATDRCGAAEVIEEGVSGFRVAAADSEAIRERLSWLLDHRDRLPSLREAAIANARRQTWSAYAANVTALATEWTGGAKEPKRANAVYGT